MPTLTSLTLGVDGFGQKVQRMYCGDLVAVKTLDLEDERERLVPFACHELAPHHTTRHEAHPPVEDGTHAEPENDGADRILRVSFKAAASLRRVSSRTLAHAAPLPPFQTAKSAAGVMPLQAIGAYKLIAAADGTGLEATPHEVLLLVSRKAKDHTVVLTEYGFEPAELQVDRGDRVWFKWDTFRSARLGVEQVDVQSRTVQGGFSSLTDTAGAMLIETNNVGAFFFICPSHEQPCTPFCLAVLDAPDLRYFLFARRYITSMLKSPRLLCATIPSHPSRIHRVTAFFFSLVPC